MVDIVNKYVKINHAVEIHDMIDEIMFMIGKSCDINKLSDEKQEELWHNVLKAWLIVFNNQS